MRTLTFNRVIGAGAMGTVYHAELKAPGGFVRTCAVKVMKAQSGPDHEHFMARMRDEARLLGMLQDEQILGVSEMVDVEHRDAVIMEYVEGVDLADLVKENRVPPRALCELGAEIAGTLHRAHGAKHPSTGQPLNVIHRDIKPANVMITPRGGVRLLDFGVARAAFSNRESQTQGLVLGTLNYFPPEILGGSEPTQAVDIYGLGLTLWECATGKEWGSPQAQQKRFERRVDQRLAEIGDEYREIVPVLRQILQWDPLLRPDGGVVERALLDVAGKMQGEALRTWAREVIPPMIAARDQKVLKDELVGRTLEIKSISLEGGDPTPPPEPPPKPRPAPAPREQARSEAGGRAAPAPVKAPPPARNPPAKAPPKPAASGGGSAKWVLVAVGVLLGGTVGVALLLVLVGVVLAWLS